MNGSPLERSQDQEQQNQRSYDQMTQQSIQRMGSIGQIFVDNYVKGQQLQMQGDDQVAQMVERRSRLATESLRQKQLQQQIGSYHSELQLRQNVAQTKMIESQARLALEQAKEQTRNDEGKKRDEDRKYSRMIEAFRGQVGKIWENEGKVWTLTPNPGDITNPYKPKEITDPERIKAWKTGRNLNLSSGGNRSGSNDPSESYRRIAMTIAALQKQLEEEYDSPEPAKDALKSKIQALKDMLPGEPKPATKTGYNSWFNGLDNEKREGVIQFRQRNPQYDENQIMEYLKSKGFTK